MYQDRHKRIEKECEWCGDIFSAQISRIKLGQGRFCSLVCANEMQKEEAKKTWGKENGKAYWDESGWKWHWIDEGKNRVMSYPRYLWEDQVGEIPKGYLVSFKDGDPKNIDIYNLFLISRSELSALQGRKGRGKPRPSLAGENSKWWRNADTEYPYQFSKRIKKLIKTRDNYTCQCCYFEFLTHGLDVHHIDRDIKNNELDNLVTVCKSCHRAIHGTENKSGERITYFQSLLK